VFVSPSLAEPFGITITEALATGCQVVATPSGVLETLADGVVVEAEVDSESIAAGIREALARDGAPEYEPRTWDAVVDDYVALYRDVASGEGADSETDDGGEAVDAGGNDPDADDGGDGAGDGAGE